MPQFFSDFHVTSKKRKGLHGKIPQFCRGCHVISQKKRSLRKNATVFSGFRCDLQKKKVFPILISMGPGVIVPPAPPLVGPAGKMLCCLYAMTGRWASPTCSMLRRNTASIMKNLIRFIKRWLVILFAFCKFICVYYAMIFFSLIFFGKRP